jgi:hypothetical protein
MYCVNCGSAEQNDRYCSNCGQLTNANSRPIAIRPYQPKLDDQPSGTPGFVLSLLGLIFVAGPIICLPLSITGLVLSRRAKDSLFEGQPGFKLANAGFVIGIVAICITSLFMLLAIPGAWQRNFG